MVWISQETADKMWFIYLSWKDWRRLDVAILYETICSMQKGELPSAQMGIHGCVPEIVLAAQDTEQWKGIQVRPVIH